MRNVDGLAFFSRDVPQQHSRTALLQQPVCHEALKSTQIHPECGWTLQQGRCGAHQEKAGTAGRETPPCGCWGTSGHAGRWGLFTPLRLSAAIRTLKLLLNQPSRTPADVHANRQQRGDVKPKPQPKRRHRATSSPHCSAQPRQALSGDKPITKSYLWLLKSRPEQNN